MGMGPVVGARNHRMIQFPLGDVAGWNVREPKVVSIG